MELAEKLDELGFSKATAKRPSEEEVRRSLLMTNEPGKLGEFRLLAAVMESALEDFQRYLQENGRNGRVLFERAATWLLVDGEQDSRVFSVRYACDVLGIDIDCLRDRLRAQLREFTLRTGTRAFPIASGA